uniref:Protein YAE1 n=1 Tax=Kalmanozyma brasiliensis (strain GHG001) TaxID=1365824 RepID=V5GLQ3_KALBG
MDASQQQTAGPSALKTPQMDQSEWASASTPTANTPSRQAFPKPLNLGSQPVASSSTPSGPPTTDTPRRGQRSSITYIASPATSVKADEGLSRNPSTSSASSRTRTGSISRATSGSLRRKPSQASQGASSDADDWLMSEEDASFSLPTKTMAERDSAKVEALFNDTGYREGITAGKLSTLQSGFDQGFNEVGAALGRRVGIVRGQVAALLLLTSSASGAVSLSTSASSGAAGRSRMGRARGANVAGAGGGSSSLPLLASPRLEEAKEELRQLAKELDTVTLGTLAEPDYEAMEHEREHQEGADKEVARETEQEKLAREQILESLQQRLRSSGARTTRLSLSSDDSLPSTSHDLLRLIAEKERHCFELREQLSTSEAQLHQLRTTWQRLATKELAYSAPPSTGAHRRDGSSSSTSDVAVDAWNSLSSRLPSNLKTQLNNLLDSLVDAPAVAEKGRKAAPPPVAVDGMLRPTGLGVLEEEGSDVVSPRSPRSPAVGTRSRSTSPNTTITSAPKQGRLASLADRDSRALGFTVDANGIATPLPTAPPTPPKPQRSSRTSILGSLTGSDKTGESSFASIFTKRLQAARENASDLLREAERKLGNAMTIEELNPTAKTPGIQLEEASNDSPWYKAAGGGSRRSPNLQPTRVEEEGVRRASLSSSSSDGHGRTASPVLGGVPGAVGVFGMLMSQGDRRKSGDSWSWGGGGEDEEWDKGKDAKKNGSAR